MSHGIEPCFSATGDYRVATEAQALAACHAALRYILTTARVYHAHPAEAARQMERGARHALRAVDGWTRQYDDVPESPELEVTCPACGDVIDPDCSACGNPECPTD